MLFAIFANQLFVGFKSEKTTTTSFNKEIIKKTNDCSEEIKKLIEDWNQKGKEEFVFKNTQKYYNNLEKEGIALFVIKEDNAVFWSDNKIPETADLLEVENDSLLFLENGWYLAQKQKINDTSFIGLILIKNEYHYSNQYLKQSFQSDFSIDDDVIISYKKTSFPVINQTGKPLFYLDYSKTQNKSNAFPRILGILFYIISAIFIIFYFTALAGYYDRFRRIPSFSLFVIGALLLLRALMLIFNLPEFWYNSDLFSPKLYAASVVFPSFGDLLINVLFAFLIAIILYIRIRIKKIAVLPKIARIAAVIGFVFPLLIISYRVVWLIKGVIINSIISYNVNNIFSLNFYSITGLFIIILLFSTLFLTTKKISDFTHLFTNKLHELIIAWTISLAAYFTIIWHFELLLFCLGALIIVLLILLWWFKSLKKNIFEFSQLMLFVLIFSIFATFVLYINNNIKELELRKSLALSLAVQQDPITEFAYLDIEQKIVNDSTLISSLSVPYFDESRLKEYLGRNYFSDYWSKYDVQVTVCRSADSLLIKPDNIQKGCFDFFNSIIRDQGKPTVSCDLYFLDKGNGRSSYIAQVQFPNRRNVYLSNTRLFIEFDAKFVPKGLGYPELLLDEKVSGTTDLSDYSYARYFNKDLISQFGKYLYSLDASHYGVVDTEFKIFDSQHYNHLYYNADANTILIVSRKSYGIMDFVTPFSYMLVLFTTLVLIYFVTHRFIVHRNIINFNFQYRIQFSMIFIVLVSLLLIGIVSIYFILNIYSKKNEENIKEKTHSITIELESKLSGQAYIDKRMSAYVQDLLLKFSNVFFTDINMFDLDGNLIASSRSKIFDEGLIGKRIDPIALSKLKNELRTMYVHEEKIGELNYISSYAPFRNNQNEVIAYLNLPYFAKYNETKKELSTFIVAIINIYILLFALAIIIAFIISGYVTKPLVIIKEKIARLKFGSRNEKINWDAEDEIGNLVVEYNRMVDQLEYSAELLAKSERESAWREMAKQVAHEIKNPLTPMKLSVQYLEKSLNESKDNLGERLNKFSKTMIEQIDTLSNIATAFSDFAKMPTIIIEKTNFTALLSNIVDLYKGIKIKVTCDTSSVDEAIMFIDPKMMNQVLTNLIRNSEQSFSENSEGEIKIKLNKEDKWFVISISDNGCGIPDDKKDKIFVPSFTTKNSGMGLGLAMVKNIIDSFGGYITFESETNVGTTFYLHIPVKE